MVYVSIQSILDSVVKQVPVLLHGKNDPSVLEDLVRNSINEYQDRAGFSGSITIEDETKLSEGSLLPSDWLSLLSAMDSHSVYIETSIKTVENESGDTEERIFVSTAFSVVAPYKITYLRDLSKTPLDVDTVPVPAAGIIKKHLAASLAIPNNRRLISMMEGLGHSGADKITDEQTIKSELERLELEMDEMNDLLFTALVM